MKKNKIDKVSKTFQNEGLEKIVLNVGIGRISANPSFEEKLLPELIKEFGVIAGQKPVICQAKQSIAGFKLRSGTVVGLKITLRKKRLNEFLNKFINVVLPRVRDFRGINPKSLDNNGNLNIGLKEHYVFPEISPDISKISFGVEITLVPKIRDKVRAVELYKKLGIPFKK